MSQPTTFINGWFKLPNELRLEILEYALPSGALLSDFHFDKATVERHVKFYREKFWSLTPPSFTSIQELTIVDAGLLPFLACPIIAELASKVFYSQNTMRISMLTSTLPPPRVRGLIRHVKIFVASADTEKLSSTIDRVSKFPNLQTIDLDISDNFTSERTRKVFIDTTTSSQSAEFRAKQLVANYYHNWRRQPVEVALLGDQWNDGLEAIVLGNLSITSPGGGASVKASWERFTYKANAFQRAGDYDLRLVVGNNFSNNDDDENRSRMTRKTVWI